MEVVLEKIGKLYGYRWIFKNIEFTLPSGGILGIKGINGSGKSTLIKLIQGSVLPSEGQIRMIQSGKNISKEKVYGLISLAAPYADFPMEFNGIEVLSFIQKLRGLENNWTCEGVMDLCHLNTELDKPLNQYSTGMLQRFKLGTAALSKGSLVLLDEPTSNLDTFGKNWFKSLVDNYCKDKTVVIASNDPFDFQFCTSFLDLTDFKPIPN